MKTLLKLTALSMLVLSFSTTAFSYEEGDASRKYDSQSGYKRKSYGRRSKSKSYSPKVRSNYSRYKRYSPSKKKRYKSKWSSFKKSSRWDNLSNREKSNVRRKVLSKKRSRPSSRYKRGSSHKRKSRGRRKSFR